MEKPIRPQSIAAKQTQCKQGKRIKIMNINSMRHSAYLDTRSYSSRYDVVSKGKHFL